MNILITGASRGIGREVALKLSEDPDNHIFTISRSSKLLVDLSREAEHNNISYVTADITRLSKKPEKLLEIVRNEFMEVDILINNAGILIPKAFKDMDQDDDDASISTNFIAPMRIIRCLLPMLHANSHIVNISSMSGYQGSSKYGGLAVYGAAKGALSILSESLAAEFGSSGPSINSLSLGAVQTEMLGMAFPGFKAPIQPEEMAEFICWFAINGHKFFNGRNLPVTVGNP